MKLDINGCSTCQNGQENYEEFTQNRKTYIQYDYRHTNGKLFSCVAKSLDAARIKRDAWMENYR